jgi:serine/threonine protein phosphatase PrpC
VQVFDGHNGSHAAEFASQRILQGILNSKHFPTDICNSLVRGGSGSLANLSKQQAAEYHSAAETISPQQKPGH